MAAIISRHLHALDNRDTDWRKWQGSEAWALRRLDSQREKIKEICPDEERTRAINILKTDYDLEKNYRMSR
jgi:hypothetical protein